MSVINQVLNQLEQRGAHTADEQIMVRAVPHTGRNYTLPLLVFGLVLIVGIAAWQWVQQTRKPVLSLACPEPCRRIEGPNAVTASVVPKAPQGLSHPEGVDNL